MSCFSPMVGHWTGKYTANGKKLYQFGGKFDPTDATVRNLRSNGDMVVCACGHCIGCRLDYSRSWADRLMLELAVNTKAVFATLTYDNDHLTLGRCREDGSECFYSLNKRDVQLFHKRLRKDLPPKTLRYYMAGEYGDRTLRPHYHAIYFGIGLDDFSDLRQIGKNEMGDPYFSSDSFASVWSNGHCLLANVNWNTCAYVARYVTKKVNGVEGALYDERGVIPEFALMSRRPGIGRTFFDIHPELASRGSFRISTPDGSRLIRLPDFAYRDLELTSPERHDILREQRVSAADDAMFLKSEQSDLSYLEILGIEEQNKKQSVKSLGRTL